MEENGFSTIIIDNTNIELKHMLPYAELALEYKYSIQIEVPNTAWRLNPEECAFHCIHGVDLDTIKKYMKNFKKITVDQVVKAARDNLDKQNCRAFIFLFSFLFE